MKTKSLSIFLVALFVVGMNLGAEEDNNENKEGENFEYEKMCEVPVNEVDLSLKTILIGNSMVGKSALSEKICKNTFPEGYSATLGFEYYTLYFNIVSNMGKTVLKYEIWDTCGNELYRSLVTNFYRNTNVCLLVYDVTNEKSFNDINVWLKTAKENSNGEIEHFVLIGTKIDLKEGRAVSKQAGENFAKTNGMKFVEVSAKTGEGIKELENILAKIIYEEFKKNKEKKKEKKKEEDDSEVDYIMGKEHTHSSSLCDCCKKICDNC